MQGEKLLARQRRVGNPMRIAIIADIHGNMPALEAVLADIQRRGIDRTINVILCPRLRLRSTNRGVPTPGALVSETE